MRSSKPINLETRYAHGNVQQAVAGYVRRFGGRGGVYPIKIARALALPRYVVVLALQSISRWTTIKETSRGRWVPLHNAYYMYVLGIQTETLPTREQVIAAAEQAHARIDRAVESWRKEVGQ